MRAGSGRGQGSPRLKPPRSQQTCFPQAPLGATNPEGHLQGPRGQEHEPWGELTLPVWGWGIGGSFLVLFLAGVGSVAEMGGRGGPPCHRCWRRAVVSNRPSSGALRRSRVRGAGGRAQEARRVRPRRAQPSASPKLANAASLRLGPHSPRGSWSLFFSILFPCRSII